MEDSFFLQIKSFGHREWIKNGVFFLPGTWHILFLTLTLWLDLLNCTIFKYQPHVKNVIAKCI